MDDYENDLVKRLRRAYRPADPVPMPICDEAATRIEVLEAFHAGNSDMQLMLYNRIKELEKMLREIAAGSPARRIEVLEQALRPFAAAVFNDNGDVTLQTAHLRTVDWLTARAALKEGQKYDWFERHAKCEPPTDKDYDAILFRAALKEGGNE